MTFITFYKYQGTGNDFILIDNRTNEYDYLNQAQRMFLCDRRFGIGADGLIYLGTSTKHDFSMRYFNSDGNESTMCGNGGRCIAIFAKHLGIITDEANFESIDGLHNAKLLPDKIILKMSDCKPPEEVEPNRYFIDTGSPHVVCFVENIHRLDINTKGKEYRNKYNANIDFCQITDNKIHIRTFERGVEDETFACGTGSVAAAIVSTAYNFLPQTTELEIVSKGGIHTVLFDYNQTVTNIFLIGEAKKVFEGTIEIN